MKFLNWNKPSAQETGEHPVGMKGKVTIRCNVWGNWWGYIGRRKVWEIGPDDLRAKWWLEEQREIQAKVGK